MNEPETNTPRDDGRSRTPLVVISIMILMGLVIVGLIIVLILLLLDTSQDILPAPVTPTPTQAVSSTPIVQIVTPTPDMTLTAIQSEQNETATQALSTAIAQNTTVEAVNITLTAVVISEQRATVDAQSTMTAESGRIDFEATATAASIELKATVASGQLNFEATATAISADLQATSQAIEATLSITPTFTPKPSMTATPTSTFTATHTATATPTATQSPTVTLTATATLPATSTEISIPTESPTSGFVPTGAGSGSPIPLPTLAGPTATRQYEWVEGEDVYLTNRHGAYLLRDDFTEDTSVRFAYSYVFLVIGTPVFDGTSGKWLVPVCTRLDSLPWGDIRTGWIEESDLADNLNWHQLLC